MTDETINIIFNCFDKWKNEERDIVDEKSASEIGNILFHYPINKLLARIKNENIDGKAFIESLKEGHIIQDETGWALDEVYQIESILLKHYTFTETQFKKNMNTILKTNCQLLSKDIIDTIQQAITMFDVEIIQLSIKTGNIIEEFSDTVTDMIDDVIKNNKNNSTANNEDDLVQKIYSTVADCFMLNTQYRPQWTCSNCGNCNGVTYIGGSINTKLLLCSLCGVSEKQSIILMLRNQPTFLMINDQTKIEPPKAIFFMQIICVSGNSVFTIDVSTDKISNYKRSFFIKEIKDEKTQQVNTKTKIISKIKTKLKEIEMLEQKQTDGKILDAEEMAKMDRKEYLIQKLKRLKQELSADMTQSAPTLETYVELQKGEKSTTIYMVIDEKHNGIYNLGLYDYKTAKQPLKNANQIQVVISKNKNKNDQS
eukprot:56259_1